ncbi:P-loop containing nucleoside triphosphate hydrolase protein [Geopyxis carbonaria]|nr:P-loop containing nucleoside triphosphate hydrolase protein [Geopyxis carbonaria]
MRIIQLLPISRLSRALIRNPLIRINRLHKNGIDVSTQPVHVPPFPNSSNPMELRDYQEACIDSVLSHVEDGHRRMAISLATGSGKTVIFTQMIARLTHPNTPERATQTLIIAHRQELVEQAFEHCKRTYPDSLIEIEMGKKHSSGVADITIASVQSLTNGDRLAKFDPKRFKLILIDECHHAVAPGYLKALDHFGVLNMEEGKLEDKPLVIGVSATLSRFDGLRLGKVLDYVVYHKDFIDMIEDKWLSPVVFTTVRTKVDYSKIHIGSSNDFNLVELGKAVNTEVMNEVTVRTWMEKAGDGKRKSTIVFCVDIAHVAAIVAKFRGYGIDAQSVTGNTPTQERKDCLGSFRRGEFPVLVNCGVFTEGTDIPNIDCVLLARPTRSRNLLIQMVGRGMRLHPGKKDCHVIDMVASVEKGIIAVPTLLGLDPDEILEEESLDGAEKRIEAAKEKDNVVLDDRDEAGSPTITYTDYQSIFDLLSDTKQDFHIRSISRLAWVLVNHNPQRFVLSLSRQGVLSLFQNADSTYSVTETRAIPSEFKSKKHNFIKSKPRVIVDSAISLEEAVHAADTLVKNKYPLNLVSHHATWRKWPASEQQLKMLEKLRPSLKVDSDPFDTSKLTKGTAGDLITRYVHGGISRWNNISTENMRRLKQERKDEELRQRENVQVGKLY